MFIHIGFTHILVNSITLYYLGTQMESLYGSLRFALIYLLSGLMGNLMSFAFNDSISAGASTSLFGLFAAAIVLGRQFPYNLGIQQMARSFTMLIFLNFFFGFFSTAVIILAILAERWEARWRPYSSQCQELPKAKTDKGCCF